MGTALGQHLQGLLVADKGLEFLRKPFEQRIARTVLGQPAEHRTHRLAVPRLRHFRAQMRAKDADAVTTAHEGMVASGDCRHQRQNGTFDPRLDLGFRLWRIRHAARPATDNHPGIIARIEPLGQGFAIQPDAVTARRVQPRLVENGGIFPVGGIRLGPKLQDQKLSHGPPHTAPRPSGTVPCFFWPKIFPRVRGQSPRSAPPYSGQNTRMAGTETAITSISSGNPIHQ